MIKLLSNEYKKKTFAHSGSAPQAVKEIVLTNFKSLQGSRVIQFLGKTSPSKSIGYVYIILSTKNYLVLFGVVISLKSTKKQTNYNFITLA